MMNQKFIADKSLDAHLRKLNRVICITEHCAHGRKGLKFGDNIHRPHVARVQNMIHPGKGIMHGIGHLAVRVRNDADLHPLRLPVKIP